MSNTMPSEPQSSDLVLVGEQPTRLDRLLDAIITTAEVTTSLDPENARQDLLKVIRTIARQRGDVELPDTDLGGGMLSAVLEPSDRQWIARLRSALQATGDETSARELQAAFDNKLTQLRWEETKRQRQQQEAEARRRHQEEEERRAWRGETFHFEVVYLNPYGDISSRENATNRGYREDLGNGIVIEMAHIRAGEFMMGSPSGEGGDSEKPQHRVSVPQFFMGRTQVTQAQWRVVANLPKVNRDLNPDPSRFKGDNRPVEQVSWDDCVEFCHRLSRKTGKTYRLPSEAEWEYACRAGTTTPFHFGETLSPEVANYDGNYTYKNGKTGVYRRHTIPVGSLNAANAWGLYDMHGNVYEWCADPWHENYHGAPSDGTIWSSSDESLNNVRLLRGGFWNFNPVNCRSARRNGNGRDYRDLNSGFRLVSSPPESP